MKKLFALLLALCLLPLAAVAEEGGYAMPFRDLTAEEITRDMGTGWNLGNTMDGHSGFTPGETVWQPTITTQKLVDAVHDAGFSTMRLPVTWGTMIDDSNGYKIDEAWLSRVQDIADYAVRQDMYVIINLHHDGAEQTGWLRIAYEGEQLEEVKRKFAAVWQQIAETFRDYDEHVIFEAMNEVCGDDPSEAGYQKDFRTIEMLNQLFVDTVRATGGNNAKRWLSVVPRYTNIQNVLNEKYAFTLPSDPAGHIMLSVHDYDYSFGIQANMNATLWNQEKALNLSKLMEKLKATFVDKGVPVVLGEYGAVNKNNIGNRVYYYEAMNRMCQLNGIVPVCWDIGWYDPAQDPDYTFSLFDRGTGKQLYPDIIKGILRGYYNPVSGNLRRNIVKIEHSKGNTAPATEAFTKVDIAAPMMNLASGTYASLTATAEPADAQDTLLYATSNPDVVTVSKDGVLHGKAQGSAQVTVRSANGSVQDSIVVVVGKAETEKPVSSITFGLAKTSLAVGETADLAVTVAPADHTDSIYFVSSDASVVTVNSLGKLVAVADGVAEVKAVSASGCTQSLTITVGNGGAAEAPAQAEATPLNLGIGVYYNDAAHNYYMNETSPTIAVSGDGTYTLTYDAINDSTKEAKAAGVLSLNGTGAIYIYDVDGNTKVLASCDIHYDEILLDGVPLTITEHAPKSALKSSGKLDTNDPINAWDGSITPDVTASPDKVITFVNNPKPRTITITFTLSNWQYQ
ncbi:MAG: cellulase family glycosylhydrolase [Clostridia bacterium]|nr:cellulase family glycosylhydrolase [Clostridia bacterium]